MPKSKRPRKPYLGNKFRISSVEAKLLTSQMAQNMQAALSWVLALDKRLRALEPQPDAVPATDVITPATPAEGEATAPPTGPLASPDGGTVILDSTEEPGNE